jgi:hypothetical protein
MLRQPLHHQRRASCNTGQEKLARARRVAGTVMALAVVDDDMVIPGGPYVTPRYTRADSFDAGFKVAISHTRDLLDRTGRDYHEVPILRAILARNRAMG